ncbi:hypothetical protein CsSME_00040487 [Camellia sinensis var. sinensis]
MANNDETSLSVVDSITPKFVRWRDGPPAIPTMASLETFSRGRQDKRARSTEHSKSPEGHRWRGESHAKRLEHKLRDQDVLLRKMAAEMETSKRQIKGKGVVGVGDHSECTPPRRFDSRRQHGPPSLSLSLKTILYAQQ